MIEKRRKPFQPNRPHLYRLHWRKAPKARRLRIYKGNIHKELIPANMRGKPWVLMLTFMITIKGRGRPMLSRPCNKSWRH